MSKRTFRTRNGKQARSAPGRCRQGAVTGLRMFGPRGVFSARPSVQTEPEEPKEEDDDRP